MLNRIVEYGVAVHSVIEHYAAVYSAIERGVVLSGAGVSYLVRVEQEFGYKV